MRAFALSTMTLLLTALFFAPTNAYFLNSSEISTDLPAVLGHLWALVASNPALSDPLE